MPRTAVEIGYNGLIFVFGFGGEGRDGICGNCFNFGATRVALQQLERIGVGAPLGAVETAIGNDKWIFCCINSTNNW